MVPFPKKTVHINSVRSLRPLRLLITVMCVMLGVSFASPARAQDAIQTAGLIGTFKTDNLQITINEAGGKYECNIVAGEKSIKFTGKLEGQTITGTVVNDNVTNPFSARADGNVLTFTLGAGTYQLTRVFTAAAFAGTFVGKSEAITIDADNDSATGTLKLGETTYTFAANLKDKTLIGRFTHRGVKNEFSAVIAGDVITLNTGIESFKLNRSKTASRVEFLNSTHRTKVLASSEFVIDSTILVSPDNNRVAYVENPNGKRSVVVNGVAEPSEYRAGGLLFSPDSKHVAYLNSRNSKWHFVKDGVESEAYEDFGIGDQLFSPDSKRWAYAVRLGKYFHVIDNKGKSAPYDHVSGIVFSPDSKRLSYLAKRNGKAHIVIEGIETPISSLVEYGRILFSPDSKRVAYVVAKESMQHVIVDGKASTPYESIHSVYFSPDSKRVANIVGEGVNRKVIADGIEPKLYRAIGDLAFSPDSKTIAYTAKRDGQWRVVINNKEELPYDAVTLPLFSSDSRHMAYAVFNEKTMFVEHDSRVGKKYHRISDLKFSPDGKRLAYLVFNKSGKWQVEVDGEISRSYDEKPIGLTFSSDSRHVAFAGKRQRHMYMVIDSIEGNPVGEMLPGSRPVFDSPNILHTVIRRKNEFVRLEIEILQ